METLRTKLRRFKDTDLQNLIDLETNPEIMRFTPNRIPLSPQKIEERLRSIIEKEGERTPMGIWAAEEKQTGEFIGWFSLIVNKFEAPELGFMIVQKQWGKGFATEVAARLVKFGFTDLGLKSIVAVTDPDNMKSQKVLKKLGFVFLKNESSLNVFELNALPK